MGQPPVGRSWNYARKIPLVMICPMQKAEKRSDVRRRRGARAGGRGELQLVLYSGEQMLRGQRPEVLAWVSNAEPLQKAPRAQESAIAGLRLEASYLAQMFGEGVQ